MAKQTFTTGQVLTAAQMTSLQQTAMLGGAASAKIASYTLVAADAGTAISMSNAGATTITVNTSLFAAGDTVQITNLGAGVCTITAGTATVNTSASLALAQYESGTLDFTSTSAAIFIKGAGAAAASGGASFTLLNSGGTALTGSSVTVSGISGQNTLMIFVAGGRFSTLGQTMRIRFDGSTTIADYEMATNIAQPDTTYSANLLYGQDNPGSALVDLGTADAAADLFYASVTMFGANTTNPKPFIYNGATTFRMITGHAGQGIFKKAAAISSITILGSGTFNAGTVFVYGSAV